MGDFQLANRYHEPIPAPARRLHLDWVHAQFKVPASKLMAVRRGKLQKVGDDVLGIALTSHAAHFHGDKMLWLRDHIVAINWSGWEDLKDAVAANAREPKRR
jgi:hypothetical protein